VFFQAGVEIGTVCGSSAWCSRRRRAQLAAWPVSPQAQEDVWREDSSIQISSALAPTGTVERVDGGFLLRGRWSFSSGCDFCQWAVLGGTVPPTQRDAPPDVRSFLVPRSDYSIDDNWHVMGLCGTGSKDIVVEKAFVPEYRTLSYLDTFHLAILGASMMPLFVALWRRFPMPWWPPLG
jgi:3-hydroxy-9,10-secoandrosta-1,3,5(10)-triene-9,17-dione monooxygenase